MSRERRVAVWSALFVLVGLAGCNALTGVSELEKVDCVDCIGDGASDSPTSDSTSEVLDGRETALEATSDSLDGDVDAATDAVVDVLPDLGPDAKACFTDLGCDDLNVCTSDQCIKSAGLDYGVCSSSKLDADGDGESPTLGLCGPDCNDANKLVFSKQTAWFTTAYTTPSGSSFDYNCSGKAEQERTVVYKCTRVLSTCSVTAGWLSVVPACGATGSWVASCTPAVSGGCTPVLSTVTQACH